MIKNLDSYVVASMNAVMDIARYVAIAMYNKIFTVKQKVVIM